MQNDLSARTWYANHNINAHNQGLVIDEATGANVAVIYNAGGDEETRDVADLISAAPQMLAVLRSIADTPLEGEICPDDLTYLQVWDEAGLRGRLTEIVRAARDILP